MLKELRLIGLCSRTASPLQGLKLGSNTVVCTSITNMLKIVTTCYLKAGQCTLLKLWHCQVRQSGSLLPVILAMLIGLKKTPVQLQQYGCVTTGTSTWKFVESVTAVHKVSTCGRICKQFQAPAQHFRTIST